MTRRNDGCIDNSENKFIGRFCLLPVKQAFYWQRELAARRHQRPNRADGCAGSRETAQVNNAIWHAGAQKDAIWSRGRPCHEHITSQLGGTLDTTTATSPSTFNINNNRETAYCCQLNIAAKLPASKRNFANK
eukprot:scaffold7017_cov134-Cylindrotheca_fusiformis.AAC.22